ncbi:MAG: hypothetical protein KDE35_13240, partial [Geminicoccaceae bacterium]|nr:hypothetical protein [Geminicoccaceae bacterium]
ALKRGDIDLYWEETGTALTIFYRRRPPLGPEASLTTLRKDDAEEGLVWLEPSRIDNRFVMVMRRAEATSLGLKGLSDLGARFAEGWEMSLATDDEFFARPDGLKPLQTFYKFTWPQERVVRLPPQRPIQALLDGDVNAAIVRESDGVLSRADMLDLVRLEDDRGFYPPYLATPVVREDALRRFPGIVEPLDHLARVLDNDVMREMALRLTERPEDVDAIARAFLEVANLLPR